MPAGRPTEYNEEILKKTESYLESCNDTEEDKEHNIKRIVNLPSIEGLAYELKINKDTIYAWAKIHKEFSDVIDDLRSKQAKSLLNNGLSGNYNPTIAKVLLTKHGYREGIDTTTNDESINNQSEESLARAQAFDEWYKKGL